MNNTTTRTTTTAPAIVDEILIWPDCIPASLRTSCMQAIDGLEIDQQQELFDELAGQQPGKVRQPAAWLRKMAKLARDGTFAEETAHFIREARASRVRAAAHAAAERVARAKPRSGEEEERTRKVRAAFDVRAAEILRAAGRAP